MVPLFDAGDEREWAMVKERIRTPEVRRALLSGLRGLENHWASHTMNEVFVRGRWWRLDYSELGVGILRGERFGLTTRIGTFHDWADARAFETLGRRQTLHTRDSVLDGANPYSMLVVDELHGTHSTLVLPEPQLLVGRIESLRWTDDPDLPKDVLEGLAPRGRFGLVAQIGGLEDTTALRNLLAEAPKRLLLESEGHPYLGIGLDPACWWWRGDEKHALVYVPFGPADKRDLVLDAVYRPKIRDERQSGSRFEFVDGIELTRELEVSSVDSVPAMDERVRGIVFGADGLPTKARVALITSSGSLSQSVGSDAVSYTHLTLPTIYSV